METAITLEKAPSAIMQSSSDVEASDDGATVVYITSNKGGAGKSTTSVRLADYALRMGRKVIVGDCEASDTQRTFADILLNSGFPQDDVRIWSLATDEATENFVDGLPQFAGSTVILDSGANQLAQITGQASFLAEAMEDVHAKLVVVFVAGPYKESTDALRDYVGAIIKLGDKKFRTHVVLTSAEDIQQEAYHLFSSPDAAMIRQAAAKLGMKFHFLGKIPERFFAEMMRGERLTPAKMLEKYEGSVKRRRFARWLYDVSDPICAAILEA